MSKADQLEHKMLEFAHNLWWTWHPEAIDVWREIDIKLWRETGHSPIAFIKSLGADRIRRLSKDPSLHIKLHRILSDLDRYMKTERTWGGVQAGPLKARPVAYFSAEFGIHESIPVYSGGLGVLAGDHLKSASDLGVSMVGVSLLYREGYFRQRLSESGEQLDLFEKCDPEDLPFVRIKGEDGNPFTITLPIQNQDIQIGAWSANLGRVPLYFLDMEAAFRKIGLQELGLRLYGGDESVRISQEIILGIGGMRFLLGLGIYPRVIHLNEGHCAFAILEYTRHLMEEHGISFETAIRQAGTRIVFTTHTPVQAGHDYFSSDLIGRIMWRFRESLGLSHEQFMDLGRMNPGDKNESFCMTVLALKTAARSNAVSSIHGQVSRQMWTNLWPAKSLHQVPIGHITNGINVLGWLRPSMKRLFHRYFPPDWEKRIGQERIWENIYNIPDEELWHTLLLLKTRLIDFLKCPHYRVHPQRFDMNPVILTLGFARRFAEYKRPTLLIDEPERLLRLINDPERPIQIIFSGKAHPRDEVGRELVRRVYQFVTDPRSKGRVVFVEDYDINICRHLIQGVDLWLNNPRQGYEASGTSGMKVALNGGLNLSILDGWWAEGYDGKNGFGIRGSRNDNNQIRDVHDREQIFKALEEEVIPLYYNRDEEDMPRYWISMIKHAMCTLGWRFSSDRMVMDYVFHCYKPAGGISTCEMSFPFI